MSQRNDDLCGFYCKKNIDSGGRATASQNCHVHSAGYLIYFDESCVVTEIRAVVQNIKQSRCYTVYPK